MTRKAHESWRNRIVGVGEEDPSHLLANPSNFRIHPRAQREALSDLIDEVGIVQRVIVNRRTQHLIDGHLRVELALSRDEPVVSVEYVDLSLDEERKVLALFDPIGAMAVPSREVVGDLLRTVDTQSAALQGVLDDLAMTAGVVPDSGAITEQAWPVIEPTMTHRFSCSYTDNDEPLLCAFLGSDRLPSPESLGQAMMARIKDVTQR